MAAPGQAGLFDDLQEDYIDSVYELPEPSGLQPGKAWQPSYEWFSDHCRRKYSPYFVAGWLDIIGFKRSAKINNTFYINESAADAVIIHYETVVCSLGYPRFKGGWVYKLETYEQDNKFVAKLTATAILYYYIEGNKYYDNITQVFYDYELLPLQFTQNHNTTINQSQYINRISNKTIIQVSGLYPLKYTLTAGNRSITRRLNIGHVDYTNKNVPYMNITRFETWNTTGSGITHQEENIIISGVNVSYSLNVSTPFNSFVPNLIINSTLHEIKDTVTSFTFMLIFIFGVMFGSVYYMGKGSVW